MQIKANRIRTIDENLGRFINIFVKIIGTWKELDETIDIKYGVTHLPNSYNPLVIYTHEYKDI